MVNFTVRGRPPSGDGRKLRGATMAIAAAADKTAASNTTFLTGTRRRQGIAPDFVSASRSSNAAFRSHIVW